MCMCGDDDDGEADALKVARALNAQGNAATFEAFGRNVWEWAKDENWSSEEGWQICEMAEAAGLAHRAKYDPEIHGDEIDSDPGDEIMLFYPKPVVPQGAQ